MNDIPFGKFFDTQTEYDFIGAFKEIDHGDNGYEDLYMLLKNEMDGLFYAVVGYDIGGADWESFNWWLKQTIGEKVYTLEKIPPKNDNWYDDYAIFRITFKK